MFQEILGTVLIMAFGLWVYASITHKGFTDVLVDIYEDIQSFFKGREKKW
jgi:hypothetical protein